MATIIKLAYKTKTGTGRPKTRHKYKAIIRRASLGVPLLTKTFMTEDDADAWARKNESEIERGLRLDTGKASTTPLREALDTYERSHASQAQCHQRIVSLAHHA